MDDERVESIARSAVEDALMFIEGEVAPERIVAQRYYNGNVNLASEPGRSSVVATKCRDVVRAVKPALMRIFLQSGRPVEFVPVGPEDHEAAAQASEYINWVFNRNDGYRVVYSAVQDALVKKTGVVKAYHDTYDRQAVHTLTGVPGEQFMAIAEPDNVDVLAYTENPDGTVDARIAVTETKGKICIESVPPEEFFVDAGAREIDDAYIIGHRKDGRIADLIAMGFNYEDVKGLDYENANHSDLEEFERSYQFTRDLGENIHDPAMRPVTITEAYMRIDVEGTGTPQLWRLLLAGTENKLLRKELADEVPFAIFEVDPEPHSFFGKSLVEIVKEDQDAATALLRSVLDNAYMTNNPRLAYDINKVNADDAMNNEIGAAVRVKGTPMDAIREMAVPFTAGAVLPFIEYYDKIIEQKTGVTQASAGTDMRALRGTSATAADMMRSAQEAQIEIMARNLAEGGMKQLFRLLLRLAHRHPDVDTMMRLNGQYVPVDPRSWNVDMDITVNVGLGSANDDIRSATLQQMLQLQMGIYQQYGPQNGVVTLTGIRNTMADILDAAGIRNDDRYFEPMNAQREQQLMAEAAQRAQQQQQGTDPNAAYLQVEQFKAQARAQEAQMRIQADMAKARMDDDRMRDQDDADLALRAAEIFGKYQLPVNTQQIQAQQAMPRPPQG
jgi:hypothetical protein